MLNQVDWRSQKNCCGVVLGKVESRPEARLRNSNYFYYKHFIIVNLLAWIGVVNPLKNFESCLFSLCLFYLFVTIIEIIFAHIK